MPATETPAPYVGMPATYCIGSDRYAMIVVKVERNGQLVSATFAPPAHLPLPDDLDTYVARVEAEWAKRPDIVGSESPWRQFTRRNRRGGGYRWVSKGQSYGGLSLGVAEDYRDPSF